MRNKCSWRPSPLFEWPQMTAQSPQATNPSAEKYLSYLIYFSWEWKSILSKTEAEETVAHCLSNNFLLVTALPALPEDTHKEFTCQVQYNHLHKVLSEMAQSQYQAWMQARPSRLPKSSHESCFGFCLVRVFLLLFFCFVIFVSPLSSWLNALNKYNFNSSYTVFSHQLVL